MTPEQKDEALRIVDDIIRKWTDDHFNGDGAMFALRDAMIRLGLPKTVEWQKSVMIYPATAAR